MKRTDRPRARRRTGMALSETHRPGAHALRLGESYDEPVYTYNLRARTRDPAEVRAASRDEMPELPEYMVSRIRHARDEGAADEPANAHGKGACANGGSAQRRIPAPPTGSRRCPKRNSRPQMARLCVQAVSPLRAALVRTSPLRSLPIRNRPARSLPQKYPPPSRPAPSPPQRDAKPRLQATTCPICLTMYLATCALRAPTSRPPMTARNCWCLVARMPRPCQ